MKIFRPSDRGYAAHLKKLNRRAVPDPKVKAVVEEIMTFVAQEGDAALLRYTEKFGGPKLTAVGMYVTPAEVAAALRSQTPAVKKALKEAHTNVRKFAKRSLRKSWFMKNKQGAIVGERFDPFQRVGLYIPGGTAPLISTAIMTCALASAAGVPEIVAVTPAGPDGTVNPILLAALRECGATEIYRVGGAQAIAALAHGTKTIRPVQKIFGPGNAYVVEAKRQAVGLVAIDLLPGPSEALVIADDSAKPHWVAADLLAQCEHGHGSVGLLVTDSAELLDAVVTSLKEQVALSNRRQELAKALKHTSFIQVSNMAEAIRVANDFSAEHVSIATRRPGEIALHLNTSGAIFLGGLSPIVGGDFLAGPSHTLPTGGAGKSFAGLTADQFQKRTSVIMYDEASLRASLPTIETFSALEGLDAHGRSASIRLEKGAAKKPRTRKKA